MPSPEPSQKKGHCPTCKDERNAFVRGRYDVEWHDNVDNADGVQGYYILQCAGCDAVYFQKDVHESYDMGNAANGTMKSTSMSGPKSTG